MIFTTLLLLLMALIQAPPKPTPDPLLLTTAELEEISRINSELKPLTEESNRAYKEFIDARTASERCRFADQLWISIKQLDPVQKRQLDWLNDVRKAHKCYDCSLENGKLIKPKS